MVELTNEGSLLQKIEELAANGKIHSSVGLTEQAAETKIQKLLPTTHQRINAARFYLDLMENMNYAPYLVVSQVSIDSYYEKWYAACHCHKSFQLESMMPAKRYPVLLDSEQRASLITLTTSGTASARKLTHARILLKADAGEFGPAFLDKAIKAGLDVSLSTIQRVRKTFVLEGLEAALLPRRPSQGARPRKFDGEKEAHLIALACSDPPEGYACWTLRLLAEKMVELEHFSSISHESIRQVLKKTNCVPGASSSGVSQQKLPRRS